MISAEEWDTRWKVIFDDLMAQESNGEQADGFAAALVADRETTEQFGDRPQDTAKETQR